MKKNALFLVVLSSIILGACAPTESTDVDSSVDTAVVYEEKEVSRVVVSVTDGETMLKEVPLVIDETELSLMDVMRNEFDLVENDGFVSSIEGVEQDADAGLFWVFEVNDEMVTVGAEEYILKAEDRVVWELTQF